MNGELREFVTGIGTAQLAPDLLSEPVGVEQLVGANSHHVEPVKELELSQFLDGVRQRVDADPKLANGFRLLVHLARDAALMKHEGCRQTANPAPDNDNFHDTNSQIRF